jgi:hypothetical protein
MTALRAALAYRSLGLAAIPLAANSDTPSPAFGVTSNGPLLPLTES